MTNRVAIRTGSRLHFGLLAHRPQVGRHFGGAGVMIDSPGVELSAEKSERDEVHGPNPEVASRVRKAVAKYREGVSESRQPPPCKIELKTQIPPHQGLGSGTQLALAVGKAVSILADESKLKSPELARRVGRGARWAL